MPQTGDFKGGRFSLSINGVNFSGRGAASIKPSTISLTSDANQDGTSYATVKAKLASIELSFDRGVGIKWDADMLLQRVDLTFVETDANITHLLSRATWNGDPDIDSSTGEVKGLSLMSNQYQAI